MKNILGILCFALLLLPALLQAQLTGVDLSAVEATTPLTEDQMPLNGTFYSAANPQLPPLPGDILGWPGWDLGNGYYLLDDLDGSSADSFHAMYDSGLNPPGSYGSGGYEFTNNVAPFVFPTNGLWLWITNLANGTVYANLNGTTDFVYEIFSTTNLALVPAVTNWNIETEVFPGANTNTMPFSVPTAGRNTLFLWARDWTGITSNGNETPDWWFYAYFGTINLWDFSTDDQGNSLLYDYQNGINPNPIRFMAIMTNNYVSTSVVGAKIILQNGIPFYQAVLVNDTNLADANWQPYTGTNILINLGTTDGVYNVWIGLRRFPLQAAATWDTGDVTFYMDHEPPMVVFTNPVSTTVTKPYVQLQGYANKPLRQISYDVTNAMGLITNSQGFVTDQYYDTNTGFYTTNYFQCYDIALTNGLNMVTARFQDLAGNVTTTNLNLTLDYSTATNAPVLNIVWPTNGMQISGASFTLRGRISDETATVSAEIEDTNGDTNLVGGIVERNGKYWVENLPLADGTNFITVTATDAAGNVMTTNITVSQSSVTLLIKQTPTSDGLYQPLGMVTGEISDNTYSVSVNGAAATLSGTQNADGNWGWSAQNVPNMGHGVATFDAAASPASGSSLPAANVSLDVEKGPYEAVVEYGINKTYQTQSPSDSSETAWNKQYTATCDSDGAEGASGTEIQRSSDNSSWSESDYYWSTTNGTTHYTTSSGEDVFYNTIDYADASSVESVPDYDVWHLGLPGYLGGYMYHYCAQGASQSWSDNYGNSESVTASAHIKVMWYPGTMETIGGQILAVLTGSAVSYGQPQAPQWENGQAWAADPSTLTVDGVQLGSGGTAVAKWPDGVPQNITVNASAEDYNASSVVNGPWTFQHSTACTAAGDSNNARTTIGIQEGVQFSGMPSGTKWSASAGNIFSENNGGSALFVASMSAGAATVTAVYGSDTEHVTLKVVEPSSVTVIGYEDIPSNIGTTNGNGSNMGEFTQFTNIIGPTTVNFDNLTIRENPSPINTTNLWPDGTNRVQSYQVQTGFNLECGSSTAIDMVSQSEIPSSWISSGTNYIPFSTTVSWTYQYLDPVAGWTNFHTNTATRAFSSGKQCTATFDGTPGGAQGPFQ